MKQREFLMLTINRNCLYKISEVQDLLLIATEGETTEILKYYRLLIVLSQSRICTHKMQKKHKFCIDTVKFLAFYCTFCCFNIHFKQLLSCVQMYCENCMVQQSTTWANCDATILLYIFLHFVCTNWGGVIIPMNQNAKLTEVRWSVTRYAFLRHLVGRYVN